MGVHLSSREGRICMYDSVTDVAFGPTFGTEEEADKFVEWYDIAFRTDLRADWFAGNVHTVFDRYRRFRQICVDELTGEFNPSVADALIRASTDS